MAARSPALERLDKINGLTQAALAMSPGVATHLTASAAERFSTTYLGPMGAVRATTETAATLAADRYTGLLGATVEGRALAMASRTTLEAESMVGRWKGPPAPLEDLDAQVKRATGAGLLASFNAHRSRG
jgi:hypothetical protein